MKPTTFAGGIQAKQFRLHLLVDDDDEEEDSDNEEEETDDENSKLEASNLSSAVVDVNVR